MIANVGARPWDRDDIDRRILENTIEGRGQHHRQPGGSRRLSEASRKPAKRSCPADWNLETMEPLQAAHAPRTAALTAGMTDMIARRSPAEDLASRWGWRAAMPAARCMRHVERIAARARAAAACVGLRRPRRARVPRHPLRRATPRRAASSRRCRKRHGVACAMRIALRRQRAARRRRRPRQRGLPVPQRLHARRCAMAASAPVLVYIHGGGYNNGSGSESAVRRRAPVPARRRGGGHGQPSPQRLRLSVPRASSATRRSQQSGNVGQLDLVAGAAVGARARRANSAATPATSPCSASPAAAPRSPR